MNEDNERKRAAKRLRTELMRTAKDTAKAVSKKQHKKHATIIHAIQAAQAAQMENYNQTLKLIQELLTRTTAQAPRIHNEPEILALPVVEDRCDGIGETIPLVVEDQVSVVESRDVLCDETLPPLAVDEVCGSFEEKAGPTRHTEAYGKATWISALNSMNKMTAGKPRELPFSLRVPEIVESSDTATDSIVEACPSVVDVPISSTTEVENDYSNSEYDPNADQPSDYRRTTSSSSSSSEYESDGFVVNDSPIADSTDDGEEMAEFTTSDEEDEEEVELPPPSGGDPIEIARTPSLPIEEEFLDPVDVDFETSTKQKSSTTAVVDTSESEEAPPCYNDDIGGFYTPEPSTYDWEAPSVIPLFEQAVLLVDNDVPDSFIHDDPVALEEDDLPLIVPVDTEVVFAPIQEDEPAEMHDDPVALEEDDLPLIPVCTEVAVATLQDDEPIDTQSSEDGGQVSFNNLVGVLQKPRRGLGSILSKITQAISEPVPVPAPVSIFVRGAQPRSLAIPEEIVRQKIKDSITFEYGRLATSVSIADTIVPTRLIAGILEQEGNIRFANAGLNSGAIPDRVVYCMAYFLLLRMRTSGAWTKTKIDILCAAALVHAPAIAKKWFGRICLLPMNHAAMDTFSMKTLFTEKGDQILRENRITISNSHKGQAFDLAYCLTRFTL